MSDAFEGIVDRYRTASAGFRRVLAGVRADQWTGPTPCADWDVRALVNHVTRGNLNYQRLLAGGSAADFLRLRDADALGVDPLAAFDESVRSCAAAFDEPGALDRVLDYPLGRVPARQGLAGRTPDTAIHTWDLARAVGGPEELDQVSWLAEHLDDIYAGLPETPASADTTHRFFAAPHGTPGPSAQDRLLHRFGRTP